MARFNTARPSIAHSSVEHSPLTTRNGSRAGMPADSASRQKEANLPRNRGVSNTVARRMNLPSDVAVMDLEADCGPGMDVRILRGALATGGDFAGGSLTTRARIQGHDRDIGRWKRNPMKTKLLLALAAIFTLGALGCASAAPRYHTYSLPKYQASVEVQAPIGKEPEVVARITFGELGGPAR